MRPCTSSSVLMATKTLDDNDDLVTQSAFQHYIHHSNPHLCARLSRVIHFHIARSRALYRHPSPYKDVRECTSYIYINVRSLMMMIIWQKQHALATMCALCVRSAGLMTFLRVSSSSSQLPHGYIAAKKIFSLVLHLSFQIWIRLRK